MESYEIEYEKGIRLSTYLIAGSIAGLMEHSIMFPVDVVKTRMQSITSGSLYRNIGIFSSLKRLLGMNGFRGLMKGYPALASGAIPAHALYFSSYEFSKSYLSNYSKSETGITCIAGSVATVFHDIFMTPAEAVKQRMQLHNSPYTNCRQCSRICFQKEGTRVFYRAFSTQLLMNIPFQVTHFLVYENMKKITNPDKVYNVPSHFISGSLAGAIAAAITTPLDVCKTLLNTQDCPLNIKQNHPIQTPLAAVKIIYQTHGISGFFHGMRARAMLQAPGTAVSWVVYELFKHKLFES